jgi:hypothetical protein
MLGIHLKKKTVEKTLEKKNTKPLYLPIELVAQKERLIKPELPPIPGNLKRFIGGGSIKSKFGRGNGNTKNNNKFKPGFNSKVTPPTKPIRVIPPPSMVNTQMTTIKPLFKPQIETIKQQERLIKTQPLNNPFSRLNSKIETMRQREQIIKPQIPGIPGNMKRFIGGGSIKSKFGGINGS